MQCASCPQSGRRNNRIRSAPSVFKPPFEGQALTAVGFKPRLVNNVVVRDDNGYEALLPLDTVETGLKLNNSRWPVS